MIGAVPRTDWLPAALARDGKGFVLTGDDWASRGVARRVPAPVRDDGTWHVRGRRRAPRLGQARGRSGRRRGGGRAAGAAIPRADHGRAGPQTGNGPPASRSRPARVASRARGAFSGRDSRVQERAVPPAGPPASSGPHRSRIRGAARPRGDGRARPGIRGFASFARFAAAYGETPRALFTRRRIERAKTLLRTANLPVTEMCFLVGFASLGSFGARSRARRTVAERPTATARRPERRPTDPRMRRPDVDPAAPGRRAIGKKRGGAPARLRCPWNRSRRGNDDQPPSTT